MLQVKIFDCEHELDLESEINLFLKKESCIINIKYQIHSALNAFEEMEYSYSAFILYEKKE